MIKSQVVARFELLATHFWTGAPEPRKYLSFPHAHVFKFEARAEVSNPNRQIEFHDLRGRLEYVISEIASLRLNSMPSFGGASCEHIGIEILKRMPDLTSIVVSEDGQFDAIVYHIKPPMITLCGSTKFVEEYRKAEDVLEKQGWAVMSVGSFPNAEGRRYDKETKDQLDTLHKEKIAASDAIYVINPGGYIGESTRGEIAYARILGKVIMSLEALE